LIIKSNEEANNLIKKAELEIENLKDVIFDGRIFIFEKNTDKISKSIIGISKVIYTKIDSTILSKRDQINDLITLCEFPITTTWNLV